MLLFYQLYQHWIIFLAAVTISMYRSKILKGRRLNGVTLIGIKSIP